jgi:hypothetical protein
MRLCAETRRSFYEKVISTRRILMPLHFFWLRHGQFWVWMQHTFRWPSRQLFNDMFMDRIVEKIMKNTGVPNNNMLNIICQGSLFRTKKYQLSQAAPPELLSDDMSVIQKGSGKVKRFSFNFTLWIYFQKPY